MYASYKTVRMQFFYYSSRACAVSNTVRSRKKKTSDLGILLGLLAFVVLAGGLEGVGDMPRFGLVIPDQKLHLQILTQNPVEQRLHQ